MFVLKISFLADNSLFINSGGEEVDDGKTIPHYQVLILVHLRIGLIAMLGTTSGQKSMPVL
jgi:hypothetical protein